MKLVIVESPEQAESLEQIIGTGYVVKASLGEVRRLALHEIRVAAGGEIAERYEAVCDRRLALAAIRKTGHETEAILLATHPDREGELLAWDILECLPPRDRRKAKRIVLHEVTPEAVRRALETPRVLDMRLVDAARARRLLDHLVSRELEPLLAKWGLLDETAHGPDLAQMAALRMLVEAGGGRSVTQIHSQLVITLERCDIAGLAKTLAEKGIGRSRSLVAAVKALVERGWAIEERGRLIPTPRGEDALFVCLEHFPDALDLDAIAKLENQLDEVAAGRADRVRVTAIFFFVKIAPALEEARREVEEMPGDEPEDQLLHAETRKETA